MTESSNKKNDELMYYRFIYFTSGKWKTIYEAKVLLWQNGIIQIRDIDGKEHRLVERYIKNIKPIKLIQKTYIKSPVKYEGRYIQQELF